MATLLYLVLILGVFLPAVFCQEKDCPKSGDPKVDWTKDDSTWYYCQTTLKGRTTNSCYVEFKKTGDMEMEATSYYYFIGDDASNTGNGTFKMTSNGKGEYTYPGRQTRGVNMKVTDDGNCMTYWQCSDDNGQWNGPPGSGAYFKLMCKKPELCMPKDKYTGETKKILEEAMKANKDINAETIDDFDQKTCMQKFADKYKI